MPTRIPSAIDGTETTALTKFSETRVRVLADDLGDADEPDRTFGSPDVWIIPSLTRPGAIKT